MGRIRPAQCRLPPAFWSTKVFWSGMMSVVSWVCGQGESKVSSRLFLGGKSTQALKMPVVTLQAVKPAAFCVTSPLECPLQAISSGKHLTTLRSLLPALPPAPNIPLSSTGSALWTCLASVRAPREEKG